MTAAGLIAAVEKRTGFRPSYGQIERAAAAGFVSDNRAGGWRTFDSSDVDNFERWLRKHSRAFASRGNNTIAGRN